MPPYLKLLCRNFLKKLFKKTPEGVAEPPHTKMERCGGGSTTSEKGKGVCGIDSTTPKKEGGWFNHL
jgi:hypothetical protein